MNQSDEDALVRYISLVRREGGEPLIGIPYREMSVDPDLIASFVMAVIIFENRQLKTFSKEGYIVVIEEGKHVVGLLIVDKIDDDAPYRKNLRELIDGFEQQFDTQLINWKGDIRPFREFALSILSVYPYRDLDIELVPVLIQKSEASPDLHVQIPWSVGQTDQKIHDIIGFINGKRSVREIMEATSFTEGTTRAIFSMLERYSWIMFTRNLTAASRLIKLTEPPKYLLGVYGDELTKIVEMCDGIRSLDQVCNELSYSMEVVRTVAKNLIDAGVLGYHE
jgi:hypothetical protein